MNKLKSLNPMTKIALIAFIFFFIWRAYLIVRYKGLYAFDEMYHISSSDAYFHSISEYNRAPYLNWTVRFLTSIFGRHYYTYKLIPFVMSLVSIGSLIYLASKLFRHVYSVVLFTLLCAGHCVLIVNHLYIRMYVWDEAVISLLAVIIFKISQVDSLYKKIGLHTLYFATSAVLYLIQPTEQSSIAVLFVGIGAWCLNYLGRYLIPFLKKRKLLIPVLCLLIPLMLVAEYIIVLLKIESTRLSAPSNFIHPKNILPLLANRHTTLNINTPYFTLYFICNNLFLLIGLIGYGYLLFKNRYEKNNMTGIYALAALPFIAYNMLYFDKMVFRTYAAYMPILIFIAILWLDSFTDTKRYRYIAMATIVITIFFSQTGIRRNPITGPIYDWLVFIKYPNTTWETTFEEYEALVTRAQQDIDEGRKCIGIWTSPHQRAAFELDGDYPIIMEDSVNISYGYTTEDIEQLLAYLAETDDQYVLLISFHANWRIENLLPGTIEFLCETYPYNHYGAEDAYLFYIN